MIRRIAIAILAVAFLGMADVEIEFVPSTETPVGLGEPARLAVEEQPARQRDRQDQQGRACYHPDDRQQGRLLPRQGDLVEAQSDAGISR